MRSKIVADSSVVLKWLYQENEGDLSIADSLLKSALVGEVVLMVPELVKYEIGNALLKGKRLSESQGREAMGVLYSLPIKFVTESEELAKETFKLGVLTGSTYYDASFAALAKQEEAILVTANSKHQSKVVGVKVVAIEDYK